MSDKLNLDRTTTSTELQELFATTTKLKDIRITSKVKEKDYTH